MQPCRLLRTITLVCLLLNASMCVVAENLQWKWIGPETGKNLNLVPDPQHSNIWYCLNDGKLFRSTNSTESWIMLNFDPSGFIVHPISSRIFASKVESELTTFYSSTDFGKTFVKLSSLPLGVGFVQSPLQENQVASLGPIYSSGNIQDAVRISSDGGRSWTDITSGIPLAKGKQFAGCEIYDVRFNSMTFSDDPNTLFLGADYTTNNCEGQFSVLLVTPDLGKTWSFTEGYAGFQQDPYFPDRIFAWTGDGLGQVSQQSIVHLTNRNIDGLITFPNDRNHLLATGLESHDGGITWQKSGPVFPRELQQIVAMREPAGGFLVTTSGGIYKKIPGHQWENANKGFHTSSNVNAVASSAETVFAALESSFFYRSTDSGRTWTDLTFRLPNGFVNDVAVDPEITTRVIIQILKREYAKATFYLSTNAGQSWRPIFAAQSSAGSSSITFDPKSPKVVYFTVANKIFKSIDGGVNPRFLSNIKDARRVILDRSTHGFLIVPTCYSIWKSLDGGKTVTDINNGIEPQDHDECPTEDVGVPSLNAPYLNVTGRSVIFRTDNGGDKWREWSGFRYYGDGHGDPWGGQRIYPVDDIGQHYFVTNNASFLESKDGGKTWINLNKEFFSSFQWDRRFHEMTDPQVKPFFVATSNGVFVHN